MSRRKEFERKRASVRMPVELYELVRKVAVAEWRTITDVIIEAIDYWLQEQGDRISRYNKR